VTDVDAVDIPALEGCPVVNCRSNIIHSDRQFLCRWHWKRLPLESRDELRRLHRVAPTSLANSAAIAAALEYLARRQPRREYVGSPDARRR
jgi:hypothetical protein